jgi:hypothetical protein
MPEGEAIWNLGNMTFTEMRKAVFGYSRRSCVGKNKKSCFITSLPRSDVHIAYVTLQKSVQRENNVGWSVSGFSAELSALGCSIPRFVEKKIISWIFTVSLHSSVCHQ